MSTKVQARIKKHGSSAGQTSKGVVGIDKAAAATAAYTYLGERLGGIATLAGSDDEFRKALTDLVNESLSFNAPSSILNVLDGFLAGYNKAKGGT